MRIASITAGAAGMYCGSCMKDNTLATALIDLGHDTILLPTYTPVKTDEPSIAVPRIFFGGVNVFLEQSPWTRWLFRRTPRSIDALFNRRGLLNFVGGWAGKTDYSSLGALTISLLEGRHGNQRKEVDALIDWLKSEFKPDAVILTNALLSGIVPALKESLGVPVFVTLQGDDVFLNELPEAERQRCCELIRRNGESAAGYIATSRAYADLMAGYLGIDRGRIRVVYPGINLKTHGSPRAKPLEGPPVLGFFARLCPEKGFHNLVDAYIQLRKMPGTPTVKLRYGGWHGPRHREYLDEQNRKLAEAGYAGDVEHVKCPDLPSKRRFFEGIDVLSVPAEFHEPKGLYIQEAWANGVPVVQPASGSFPELIEATGGGRLVPPGDAPALAHALQELLMDRGRAAELGRRGYEGLANGFTARHMAQATLEVLNSVGRGPTASGGTLAVGSRLTPMD
jgi:glycosyltransferase involved in cell wall biosynthesis